MSSNAMSGCTTCFNPALRFGPKHSSKLQTSFSSSVRKVEGVSPVYLIALAPAPAHVRSMCSNYASLLHTPSCVQYSLGKMSYNLVATVCQRCSQWIVRLRRRSLCYTFNSFSHMRCSSVLSMECTRNTANLCELYINTSVMRSIC